MDPTTIPKKKSSRNFCCAYNCSNTPSKNGQLAFHRFPKDSDRRSNWRSAVKRKGWTPTDYSVLCSEHFHHDAYQCPPGIKNRTPRLHKDAVPTLFPSYPALLQPVPTKKRRTIARKTPLPTAGFAEDINTSVDVGHSEERLLLDDGASTSAQPGKTARQKPKAGRPKISLTVRITRLKRKMHALSQKVYRLQKKSRIHKNLLDLLQSENKIQHAKLDSIDGCLSELVANQATNRKRKTNKQFSQKVKEFSLTMYYYSPRAYAYLRTVLNLPTPRTIRRWLESVDCEPGFLTDIINMIGLNIDPEKNAFSLVLDSMSIRKRAVVERSSDTVAGYVTIGDSSKLASEALVFLLVPLLGGVRHPIGYFYVDKIDSEMQSQLISQCLKLTAEANVRIVNVTCDGCAANITTLKKLGADIPDKPHFKHPTMDHQVYTILDPVHMLKLARNALGKFRQFQAPDGVVDYRYIEDLVAMQDEMGLRLANKLTQRHLNWKNMKMKVKLSAEMLSTSVADALTYLSETNEKYKDAKPTINFIRQIDRLFDILNTHNPYGRGFKSPLRRENITQIRSTLHSTLEYLDQLKLLNGRNLNGSRRKTFIHGFKVAAYCYLALGEYIFSNFPASQYLLSYKIGQDHIETLFSKIRSKGGFNNNPDVIAFKSALKALLVKSDITPSPNANCIELCDSASTTSTTCSLLLSAKKKPKPVADDDEEDEFMDENYELHVDLSKPVADIVQYIAGYVIRTLKLRCDDCSTFVTSVPVSSTSRDDLSLISVKDRGGLYTPNPKVTEICVLTEKVLRSIVSSGIAKNTVQITVSQAMTAVLTNYIHQHFPICHGTALIKSIISRYSLIRVRHETTKLKNNVNLRQKLHRLVVFSHI